VWLKALGLLLLGYVCIGRSFAYLPSPALKLFVGDLTLGTFLLTHPGATLGRWSAALLKHNSLSGFAWMLLLFMQYGALELVRGLSLGYDPLTAAQNLVFNIYPLFFLIGAWMGSKDPAFLPKFIRIQAWCSGLYGLAYVFVLNRLDASIPGSTVPWFGQAGGAALALIGLMCFERSLARSWLLILMNAVVMLAIQVRAEWVSFLVALIIWAVLTGRTARVLVSLQVIAVILLAGYLADVRLPSPKTRGGEISTREIVGRAVAAFDPEWAGELARNSRFYAGTISFRVTWWKAIWESTHSDPVTALLGQGYGYRLGDLVPYLRNETIRTPHSVFFYALGYTGWIGVVLFVLYLAAIVRLAWRVFVITGQPFGIVFCAMAITGALFGNLFETPFGAIPFYLLAGISAAPALRDAAVPVDTLAVFLPSELRRHCQQH
jgi:hypothetical protein